MKKKLSRTLYRASFRITGLGFCFCWGSYFPILWDLSISSTVILSFMFLQIVLAAIYVIWQVLFCISCRKIQVYLEYGSCLSICFSKIAIMSCSFKLLSSRIFYFFFVLLFVFLVFIKLNANKFHWFLQLVHVWNSLLIWFSCVVLTSSIISFIFCSTFRKHLIKISPHSGDCKFPAKTISSAVVFKAKKSFKLLSLGF